MSITKTIIYHRISSVDPPEFYGTTIEELVKCLWKDEGVKRGYELKKEYEIITDKADIWLKQFNFHRFMKKAILESGYTIYTYSLSTLIAPSPVYNVIKILDSITTRMELRFINVTIPAVYTGVTMFTDYLKACDIEKGRLLTANRILEGRPKVDFDINAAIKLKERGFSYRQIARQLCVSYSTVYQKLPKEIKKTYSLTMHRIKKREEILGRELTELEREKIENMGEGGRPPLE